MIFIQLFYTFLLIGIFGFGGGYAMIPIIEEEVVRKHKWIDSDLFADLIAVAQSCPGVFAINISTFIGYKLGKTRAALLASLGTALPSFIIILLIALFFHRLMNVGWIAAMFRGIRPAVVALIAVPTFNMAKSAKITLANCWIPIVTALLIWLLGVNPIYIILAAAVQRPHGMIFIQLFYTFLLIGIFGFGGGYGMLSLIQTETVVRHSWLSSAEFTNIVAISQMTPGPIGINSATYCGYAAVKNAGYGELTAILGSATATFALVLPSLVLMILISKLFMKYMDAPVVRSVFAALRPVVVGLLAAATLLLCNSENFSSPEVSIWQFAVSLLLFAATFVGTKFININPIRMICYAAFAGLLLLY